MRSVIAIDVSAGHGGSITPSARVAIGYGLSKMFAIRPRWGYSIDDVRVDGVSVGTVSIYMFSNPDAAKIKGEELSRIQRALETEIVKSQLESYGLTPEETRERLQGLSDEQIHLMAQASDRILAGGDGGGVVVAILVIILLVLLILYVQNKKIVVK